MNTRRSYSIEQLKDVIKKSYSIADVLRELGLRPVGGNYKTINRLVKKYNIDISHFKGQGWAKNKPIGYKRPIEDYLSNKFYLQSYKLKNRLLSEGIMEHKCQKCNNTKWLDNPIPLELHHIDGNSDNNNLANLQLLCPNCHTFTDNYRGKNKKVLATGVEPA